MAGALSNLGRESRDDGRHERDAAFQKRVAAQQFLNHHAPLIDAYLAHGGDPRTVAQPGPFAQNALLARRLAVEIAAEVLQKPASEVSMAEARCYRADAAAIVANAWSKGEDIHVHELAVDLAEAIRAADPVYDGRDIDFSKMTSDGALTASAAGAVSKLLKPVAHYNFRLGQNLVVSTLLSELTASVARAVASLSHPGSTTEDRRSLTQTLMRTYADMMVAIYTAETAFLFHVVDTTDEIALKAWIRENRPLERIVATFRNAADSITHITAAAARETAASSRAVFEPAP